MEEELWLLVLGLGAGGVATAVNRRIMKAAAVGYVALTEGLGGVLIPIRDRWRAAVEETRQEREREAAQAGASPRRVRRRQQHGERALRASAGAAGQAAAQGAVQP